VYYTCKLEIGETVLSQPSESFPILAHQCAALLFW